MRAKITGAWAATAAMVNGLSTSVPALLALGILPVLLIASPFTPAALRPVRALADAERARVSADDAPLPRPYRALPEGRLAAARAVLSDPATWRDLGWLLLHGVGWTLATLIAIGLWPAVIVSLGMPLYWTSFEPGTFTAMLIPVETWAQALTLPFLQAIAYALIVVFAIAAFSNRARALNRSLLRPTTGTVLVGEVERLTETRTAALESHGAELRRIERDLHDGVQAHLVNVSVRLGLADRALSNDPAQARPLIRDARNTIDDVLADLRGIIRGIYPPILTDRGLSGAIDALATGRDFPVTVHITDDLRRLPAPVEAAAYFVVAEALTNATRHSSAQAAQVIITEEADDQLTIRVSDDGVGGAAEGAGSGLTGIRRRVAALDGTFAVESPAGQGTTIEARLPCGS